ncbi:MAG: PAS domain-containing protein, partial [Pseudonocardiaceae bacterium]
MALDRRKGGAVAERAERVDFVPVSPDTGGGAWIVPGRPLAAFRPGRPNSVPASSMFTPGQPVQIPLPDSPALVCERGVVVQANQAAVRLAGRWLPDSLTGIPLHRLLAGPDIDTDNRTGTGTDTELIGPDGRAVPVRVARWNVPGTELVVVSLVDVSDLRAAGRPPATGESVQGRERLLEAQRIAGVGSFIWEWPTNKISCSAALGELFGGRCVDGADPFRHIHPEDLPELFRRVQALVSDPGAGMLEAEFRGLPEHGETYYLGRLRAERSSGGQPLRLVGTVQEITQVRALERALRAEQHRLAQAQRVARIGTWEWDPDADRLVWSDMMRTLYGVSAQQATYQAFLSLVHPEDREWVDEAWRQLVVDQVPLTCEYRVLRPDGAVRIFRCHGAAATGVSGSRRLVGTVQDVTEQRAAETRMMH